MYIIPNDISEKNLIAKMRKKHKTKLMCIEKRLGKIRKIIKLENSSFTLLFKIIKSFHYVNKFQYITNCVNFPSINLEMENDLFFAAFILPIN